MSISIIAVFRFSPGLSEDKFAMEEGSIENLAFPKHFLKIGDTLHI